MTKQLLILVAALAVSACSGQSAAPEDSNSSTAAVTETAATVPAPSAFAYSPFPVGAVLTQPFHVRSDRIYITKTGAERRRATLELLEGGAAAAADDVAKQMVASGYRVLEVKDKGDSINRLAFVKKGMGRINVSTSSNVGGKPSNPHALGVIMFDWQLTPAPATAAPEAASPEQGTPVDQAATGG